MQQYDNVATQSNNEMYGPDVRHDMRPSPYSFNRRAALHCNTSGSAALTQCPT